MNQLPFISAICLTAGRQQHLEKAISCFLAQDYSGQSELVVLNTWPRQKLHVPECVASRNVNVFNCDRRPPSLGASRNMAIGLSKGTHIVTWDDDDLYLSNHLSNFGNNFSENDWVWLGSQFYSVKNQIQSIVQGSANVLAFTKKSWLECGCYEPMNCGEDRNFVNRVTSKFRGKRVDLMPDQISFIYGWGNNVYHVSGLGDDKPGQVNSWTRSERALHQMLARGHVRAGRIVLGIPEDSGAERIAKKYLGQMRIGNSTTKTVAVVELGRFGDIINILPICKEIHDKYAKPTLVVAREFASLLDGVSYVEPHILPIDNAEIGKAMRIAKLKFDIVIQAQIWGKEFKQEKLTDAFNKESWRQCGFLHRFNDSELIPVFDRRDGLREQALFSKVAFSGKPVLLVNVTEGKSSPFPAGHSLLSLIQSTFGHDFDVLDISSLKAERIFDVLGLMERSRAMVSIDTALLHLGAASGIPTVAVVNDVPWLGTAPRGNCVARIGYGAATQHPEDVIKDIANALSIPHKVIATHSPVQAPSRKIYHAVERHEEKEDARKLHARQSWDALYELGVVPCHFWEYPRTAKDIGDRRALPYLKDVLKNAMDQAGPDDIIMWTNDDIWLHPDIYGALIFHVSLHGAVTSHRCDIKKLSVFPKAGSPISEFVAADRRSVPFRHMGRDLFAFTMSWMESRWDELPDFILGASDFDLAIACMVRLSFGIDVSRNNFTEVIHPAELPKGYVSHTMHESFWARPDNQFSAPSQLHNRKLFRAWAEPRIPSLKFNAENVI